MHRFLEILVDLFEPIIHIPRETKKALKERDGEALTLMCVIFLLCTGLWALLSDSGWMLVYGENASLTNLALLWTDGPFCLALLYTGKVMIRWITLKKGWRKILSTAGISLLVIGGFLLIAFGAVLVDKGGTYLSGELPKFLKWAKTPTDDMSWLFWFLGGIVSCCLTGMVSSERYATNRLIKHHKKEIGLWAQSALSNETPKDSTTVQETMVSGENWKEPSLVQKDH